jgi:histidine triad (HIT) family protein
MGAMDSGPSCVFCRIVAGAAPCHRVYEDAATLAMMDIFPVTDGHVLVITKEHFADIFAATAPALTAVAAAAHRVAAAIRAALQPDGLMVFQLNGAAAMQTVFHYHMHLLPRRAGEPLALHSRVPGDPARLAQLAERIAAAVTPAPA